MALAKGLRPREVVLVILFVRLLSVFLVQTWYVPDEYWQTLEVAHKHAFGYGALTWEWQRGIRNYLYPSVIAGLYTLLKWTGLDYPQVVILLPRILQAIISTAADYSFYKWTGRKWGLFLILTSWFWFYTSGRTLLQTLETTFVTIGLSLFPFKAGKMGYYEKENNGWVWLASVAVFVRPTSAPLWVVLGLYNLYTTNQGRLKLLLRVYLPIASIVGGALVALDSYFYGRLILTPWEFFRFNILHDVASFYGQHSWYWYLTVGVPLVLGVNLVPVVASIYVILRRPKENKIGLLLLIAVSFYIAVHSVIAHKEFRFVLPILPILLYLAQDVIAPWSRKAIKWQLYFAALTIFVANAVPAAYIGYLHQAGPLQVMPLLREAIPHNRTSIAFLTPCHSTPLYSHLHINVTTRYLNCDPPIDKVGETYEAEAFFNNPLRWWRAEYAARATPTLLVMFDRLRGRLEAPLTGYKLLHQIQHTVFTEAKYTAADDRDDEKSSLVFVFDTTGSMLNDLKQLRAGAEMVLNTALQESNVIGDFVFVPFHDPAVGPATVTRDKSIFKNALNIVHVHGGGDCPEKSLSGIHLALNVSRPRSFLYVFTDATAGDHRLVGQVLDAVQRKQSQVVFVLTGHCNDLQKPSYKVYHQIAAASFGQVFHLNKTNVHNVLDFVRSSIRGRSVNLGSIVKEGGHNYTQELPVDSTLSEVTVSVSGAKPKIKVVNPSGEELRGPPQLVTTLDLSEIMVVKVIQPEPGNWTITVGSEHDYSVKLIGVSNLTFSHGFSVHKPATIAETSYRPLKGTYNHMLVKLSQADAPVEIDCAEIQTLDGRVLFEVPLRYLDKKNKVYITDAFLPPDDFFYIAIKGTEQNHQELRRVGTTAVQPKDPDVPYLTTIRKIEARFNQLVVLKCKVESMVPVTAMWTRDTQNIQRPVSSLQSTSVEYVIEKMTEDRVGTYTCVAKNVAGESKSITVVELIVDAPRMTISPENMTVEAGDDVTISCTVYTEVLLQKFQFIYTGIGGQKYYKTYSQPSADGVYSFNTTIKHVIETDDGVYTCSAANRGGETRQSTFITVNPQRPPSAQILGPHVIKKPMYDDVQLLCQVENADTLQFVSPNQTVVLEMAVNGTYNAVFDINNITEEGFWKCVALSKDNSAYDKVEVKITMKPTTSIVGEKNITILNGTVYNISCTVVARPQPRIIWHRETEEFLNHTVTMVKPSVYSSVLTLNSSKENVVGTYFCYGENSEGIAYDNATIRVRRKMILKEHFSNKEVQLYSQVELRCEIDSYPEPSLIWYHNGTKITSNENIVIYDDNTAIAILKVDFEDLGAYSCEANNGFENLTVNFTLNVTGLEKPEILKDRKITTVQNGQSTIITCRVIYGNPEPTISWQYRNNASESYHELPHDVLPNHNRSQLIILSVRIDHGGEYRCIARNVVGRDEFITTLVVQYAPQFITTKEELKQIGKPIKVEVGKSAKFSCEAHGNPLPIVVWTKDYRPLVYSNNIYLGENSELIINNVSPYDSGLFTCNASSAIGSSQRNFTLVVYAPPRMRIGDKNLVEPVEVEVIEGQVAALECSAEGWPEPRVRWLRADQELLNPKKHIDEFGLRFVANITDFGDYTCIASNEYGNASISYILYVWVPPSISPPLVDKMDVVIGHNVSLQCDAVGFPVPSILWEFDNEMLTKNSTDLSYNDFGNLYIYNASTKHEGLYRCVAENIVGMVMKNIQLRVNEPPRIAADDFAGPYIATDLDNELLVTCKVTGKPTPYILWSKDDYYLDTDSRYVIYPDGSLIIKHPTEELSGLYTCTAKNKVAVVNKTVSVQIYALPSHLQLQSDESQSTVTVVEGTNVTIECPIRAAYRDVVKWYKDAVLVAQGQLSLHNVSRGGSSTYACVVSNAASSAAARVVLRPEWPPTFLREAAEDIEVVKGDDWYFDCGVDAKPEAKTKWLFNSRPLLFEGKPRLKVMNVQIHNTGTYKCIVNNKHGTIVRQFTLDVLVSPFISDFDVLDVQLKDGSNATLSCDAKGSPAPTIKWSFKNSNWHVENTTLIGTNISSGSEGLYRCDATNKAGAAHLVYRVSVVSSPKIKELVSYVGGPGVTVNGTVEVVLGTRTRISCKASGNPAPNIQWIRNGIVLSENSPDIGYADLILERVQVSQAGLYSCIVSNEAGEDQRRVKLEVLEPPKIFQTLFHNQTSDIVHMEVISGQSFYLHCHPYGNPMPQVYWFRDDLPLILYDETMVTADYGEVVTSRNALYEQSGNYTCVAINKVGNASVSYLVDVFVPPPTPKEKLKNTSIRIGRPLNLTCPVEGSPLPYVMWTKYPYIEIGGNSRVALFHDNFTLSINSTEISDSGKYSCIMTNKVGTTEVVFDVLVEKPATIVANVGNNNMENHVVTLRGSVVLKCQADGHPAPKITWLKDTQQLSSSAANIQNVPGGSMMIVWDARVRDAAQYICVADNSAGTQHRRYNLAVKVPGKWSTWTPWNFCNTTCGLGYQTRSRLCQYVDETNETFDKNTRPDRVVVDESTCKGTATETRRCHMPPCEEQTQSRWSKWSKWSPCTSQCGVGTQSRTRRCRTHTPCYGDHIEIRKCPDLPRCNVTQHQSENEVYTSGEDSSMYSPFAAEATYEFQPETLDVGYSHVEEIDSEPVTISSVYYDVKVTSNLDNSERGPCNPGYRHNALTNSCDDIEECLVSSNSCHESQRCGNTPGGYRCGCAPGYHSLAAGARCLDVNECVQETHRCEFACVNVSGGYVCACPAGHRLQADRRHCLPHPTY
ncbi:hemicentin-2-like [Achroia grisella]|uniref:hemicentin-2-like n=1 Tax=Achroia grisella TaxID=688607 RepID=UPI0027D20A00|nr:hemicentin-2-like [Achroia grisella]